MKNSFFTNIPKYNGIGVYALINNRSKKMYIGSSKNIHQRIMQHKATPPSALKSDIQQGDTFSVEILETLPYGCNQFDIFGRESFYISKTIHCLPDIIAQKQLVALKTSYFILLHYLKTIAKWLNILKIL